MRRSAREPEKLSDWVLARSGIVLFEADYLVRAVAERFVRRVAAAAKGDAGSLWALELASLLIDHLDVPGDEVRAVLAHSDDHFVHSSGSAFGFGLPTRWRSADSRSLASGAVAAWTGFLAICLA